MADQVVRELEAAAQIILASFSIQFMRSYQNDLPGIGKTRSITKNTENARRDSREIAGAQFCRLCRA